MLLPLQPIFGLESTLLHLTQKIISSLPLLSLIHTLGPIRPLSKSPNTEVKPLSFRGKNTQENERLCALFHRGVRLMPQSANKPLVCTQQENRVISTADAYYRWDGEIGWIKPENTGQAVIKLKENKAPKSVYSNPVYTCVETKQILKLWFSPQC